MIYLVVDGGYRGPGTNAGIGIVIIESAGRQADLFVPNGEILACAAVSVRVPYSQPALHAEYEAALWGSRWATSKLGPSRGGLLVFTDNTQVARAVRERRDWDPNWIISYLPRPYRSGRSPHNLAHWLASAAQSYRAGWIAEFDGCPPPGAIERLIDAGELAPRNRQSRQRSKGGVTQVWWEGTTQPTSKPVDADDWTFADAIASRLRSA